MAYALKFLGTEELFWSVLKVYYKAIEKKAKLIKTLEEAENWTDFTIEVHALKSSSKQIGAIALSERAAALEKAGNARDSEFIHKNPLIHYLRLIREGIWKNIWDTGSYLSPSFRMKTRKTSGRIVSQPQRLAGISRI